jgi:quinol monooxygenase YgiN
VFSCFDDEAGRAAHAAGQAAATLFGAEHRLMTAAPVATNIEILGSKMPKVLEGVTKGLVLRFKAKPGKEAEVAQMMRDCQALVEKEAGTLAWFANQYDASHFGTFAVFADNGSRFAHLTGQIPRALGMTGLALLGGAPEVHMVDVMTGTARQGD